MYCKKCGHENDADAEYCENCGADLSSTSSKQSTKSMSTSNKLLIVIVIVLVLGVGISAGLLLTNKAPETNNTTNITTGNGITPATTTQSPDNTSGPKLIDSGSMSGSNAKYQDGPFTYQWETYKIDEGNYLMYGTYVAGSKTVKQTVTLKKYSSQSVEITAEPKSSGKSSWRTVTSLQGYTTVEDYYWGIFRPGREQAGPVS